MARKRASRPGRPALYLVQRTGWDLWGGFSGSPPFCEHLNESGVVTMPVEDVGGVPVAAFKNRRDAEAACAALAAEAREVVCPLLFFRWGEMEMASSHSEEVWAARLRKVGLEPPTEATFPGRYGGINWHAWWEAVADHLSDRQREAIWKLCDKVKLYHVVQVVPEP